MSEVKIRDIAMAAAESWFHGTSVPRLLVEGVAERFQSAIDSATAELRRELEEVKRELATERSLMESLKELDRATSLCGHNQQYLWSPDGVGKHILCVVCAYQKADKERDTLKREVEELRKDKERLDWLGKKGNEGWNLAWKLWNGTFRQAIDAAINQREK